MAEVQMNAWARDETAIDAPRAQASIFSLGFPVGCGGDTPSCGSPHFLAVVALANDRD
jgi:hypothetical protein